MQESTKANLIILGLGFLVSAILFSLNWLFIAKILTYVPPTEWSRLIKVGIVTLDVFFLGGIIVAPIFISINMAISKII